MVRAWDAVRGAKLTTLIGHSAVVMSAAYSPDGSRIVTASEDTSARQWLSANDADLVHAAQCRIWRGFTNGEITRFDLHAPFAFSLKDRQCPPVLSWEQAAQ